MSDLKRKLNPTEANGKSSAKRRRDKENYNNDVPALERERKLGSADEEPKSTDKYHAEADIDDLTVAYRSQRLEETQNHEPCGQKRKLNSDEIPPSKKKKSWNDTRKRKRDGIGEPLIVKKKCGEGSKSKLLVRLLGQQTKPTSLFLVEYSCEIGPGRRAYALLSPDQINSQVIHELLGGNALSREAQRCPKEQDTRECVIMAVACHSPYGIAIAPLEWTLIHEYQEVSSMLLFQLMKNVVVQVKWPDGLVTWEDAEYFFNYAKDFASKGMDNEERYREIMKVAKRFELQRWL